MRASYNWLRELSGVDASPAEYAARLTRGGIEIEAQIPFGAGLDGVVVAEVRSKKPHPTKDGLSLVTVFRGDGEQEVVCGAPNVPAPGRRVILAKLGATLPGGVTIAERKIAGVPSAGMLCSESELEIGPGGEGIFVFDEANAPAPGTPVVEALGLRDTVFEVSLTPNRPDCLGHIGLARELCAASGLSFTLPAPGAALSPAEKVNGVTVRIDDAARCPRYGAAAVSGVRIGPSPFTVRYRLHCLGIRAISNVVDATNLVMLEWGHPIHAFDRKKLRGDAIVIRSAKAGETMPTLDGVERRFEADDVLICDGAGPVAVAGVMGGGNSEIDGSTSDVVIECAYFDPRSVRRTSRRLGLHTDASHRFERGVDPNAVPAVTARAAALIAALGGGAADAAWVDVYPRPIDGHTVDLRESYLALLLGYDVPTAAVTAALEGVGCRVETAGPPVWKVRTPTHRPDLQMEADLVEEVARLHGYEHIPTRTPRVRPSASGGDQGHALMRRVRAAATGAGLHEAVNYAFVSSDELARAKVETRAIPLQNPLSEERNVLRTSLLPGLLAAVARAQHRQVPDVALFEVGRVFRPMASGHLADEQRVFGCVLAGRARDWIGSKRDVDFFDGKGVVGAVLHPLVRTEGTTSPLKEPAKAPFLHPRRCAEIFVDGTRVGLLGELHPDVNDAFELVGRTVYCEIAIDALVAAIDARGVAKASPLPQFPASRRDLALLVGESVSASEVVDALRDASKPLGESVELFDLYTGEQVAVGHKSLAFRVTYRDPGATLTDDKIDKLHAKVVAAVEKQFGAQTR